MAKKIIGNIPLDSEYEKSVLKAAIAHYGNENQVDVAIEEMSELIKALIKFRRAKGCGIAELTAIIEETADVEIMLAQLKMIFDIDTTHFKLAKLERLEERILSDDTI